MSLDCFPISTRNCSPLRTVSTAAILVLLYTHTRSLSHSSCDYPHLCFSQSPPPLPLFTLSFTEWNPLPFFQLSLPLAFSPSSISLRSSTRCSDSWFVMLLTRCCMQQSVHRCIRAIQKQPDALQFDRHPYPYTKNHCCWRTQLVSDVSLS